MSWCSSEVLSLPSQMGGCVPGSVPAWVGDIQPHSWGQLGRGTPSPGVVAVLLLLQSVGG